MPRLEAWYRFLLEHPRGVLLMGLALLGVGIGSWTRLPVGLWPDFALPKLEVGVNVPGQDPLTVEEGYLSPLRQQLAQQSGLKDIRTWAFEGSGEIALAYAWGTDMELAYLRVLEALSQARLTFPDPSVEPFVQQAGPSQLPVIQAFIADETAAPLAFQSLAEQVLRRRLEQLPGVGRCEVLGAATAEVWITPDWQRLQQHRLSMATLARAIRSARYDFGVLRMEERGRMLTLSLQSQLQDLEEIKALPLRLSSDRTIRLGEVASVQLQAAPIQSTLLDAQGRCLALNLYQRPGSDLQAVSALVKEELAAFQTQYPQLRVSILSDAATLVTGTLAGLQQSLWWGAGLAVAMVFLFLGSWRQGLLVALVVPASLGIAGAGFALVGLGINLLTLAGLGIAVGILVDNGIIVIENIARRHAQGDSATRAVSLGASEIFAPLLASVLTTLCVFIPPALLGGLNGSLLRDQTLSVSWALGASLLGALLLLPVLYHQVVGARARQIGQQAWQRWLVNRYERGLHLSLLRRGWVSLATLVLLLIGGGLAWYLPRQVFPAYQTQETALEVAWASDLPFPACLQRTEALHQWLSQRSDITQVAAWAGVIELPGQLHRQLVHQAFLQITWRRPTGPEGGAAAWRSDLRRAFPDGTFDPGLPPSLFQAVVPPAAPALVLEFGSPGLGLPPPRQALEPLLDQLLAWPGTSSLRLPFDQQAPVQVLRLSPESLARYRLPPAEVNAALGDALGRQAMGRLADPNQPVPLRMGLAQDSSLRQTLRRYRLPGRGISLAELVRIDRRPLPTVLYAGSEGMRQRVEWEGKGDASPLVALAQDYAQRQGLTLRVSGEQVAGNAQQQALGWLLLLGGVLLYLIMAAQFESLWIPLLIILTLPLAFVGSVLALWMAGASLNVLSGLGFLMVSGIAVNDSILKVATILQYRRQGQSLTSAIERAGRDRFRPIVLTSLTTILAVMPLLWVEGTGVDIQRPIAWAVVGGMGVETLVSLFVLPAWFSSLAQRFDS